MDNNQAGSAVEEGGLVLTWACANTTFLWPGPARPFPARPANPAPADRRDRARNAVCQHRGEQQCVPLSTIHCLAL